MPYYKFIKNTLLTLKPKNLEHNEKIIKSKSSDDGLFEIIDVYPKNKDYQIGQEIYLRNCKTNLLTAKEESFNFIQGYRTTKYYPNGKKKMEIFKDNYYLIEKYFDENEKLVKENKYQNNNLIDEKQFLGNKIIQKKINVNGYKILEFENNKLILLEEYCNESLIYQFVNDGNFEYIKEFDNNNVVFSNIINKNNKESNVVIKSNEKFWDILYEFISDNYIKLLLDIYEGQNNKDLEVKFKLINNKLNGEFIMETKSNHVRAKFKDGELIGTFYSNSKILFLISNNKLSSFNSKLKYLDYIGYSNIKETITKICNSLKLKLKNDSFNISFLVRNYNVEMDYFKLVNIKINLEYFVKYIKNFDVYGNEIRISKIENLDENNFYLIIFNNIIKKIDFEAIIRFNDGLFFELKYIGEVKFRNHVGLQKSKYFNELGEEMKPHEYLLENTKKYISNFFE